MYCQTVFLPWSHFIFSQYSLTHLVLYDHPLAPPFPSLSPSPLLLTPHSPQYMEDPAIAAKLQECMEVVRGKTTSWDLGSMLIKPVQRIMRYHLLLTQLRKVSALSNISVCVCSCVTARE